MHFIRLFLSIMTVNSVCFMNCPELAIPFFINLFISELLMYFYTLALYYLPQIINPKCFALVLSLFGLISIVNFMNFMIGYLYSIKEM